MKITPEEYDRLREWFSIVWPVVFSGIEIAPEANPITVLGQIAAKSPAKARQGLAMAIGDIIEDTKYGDGAIISGLDQRLLAADLPTFSDLRMRFSRAVRTILRRGRISTEQEYYIARNAIEGSGTDEEHLSNILADYEEAIGSCTPPM